MGDRKKPGDREPKLRSVHGYGGAGLRPATGGARKREAHEGGAGLRPATGGARQRGALDKALERAAPKAAQPDEPPDPRWPAAQDLYLDFKGYGESTPDPRAIAALAEGVIFSPNIDVDEYVAPRPSAPPGKPAPAPGPGPDYAELACRTNFSFLRGASHPEELVDRAADLGLAALAVTDLDGVYGVVRAHLQAKKRGLKLIVGSDVTLDERPAEAPERVTLLCLDREGYANLCRVLTHSRLAHEKAGAGVPLGEILDRHEGLFALYAGRDEAIARRLLSAFADRFALAASRHRAAGDDARLAAQLALADALGAPLAAVNDVHTHERARQPLQDALTCIRLLTTVREAGHALFPNGERTLKGPAEMARLWRDRPEALAVAAAIARRCRFTLDDLHTEYPLPPVAEGVAPMELLRRLAADGSRWRWPGGVPADVQAQLDRELALIEQLDFPGYFLTVWDIARFARERGILCQGRGSAANSAVCFALGITAIDPVRMGLLFERFISVERGEPPDIDVDFEHERREEVLQYVYERYGRAHAGMVCEVISYRGKSAVRDVGKALGLSLEQVDRLARAVGTYEGLAEVSDELLAAAGLDPRDRTVRLAVALARQIQGFPRHIGIHVGGFCITRRRLDETVPLENASMPGRTVVQWDKDDLAAANLLKVDLLGLGMLTMLRKCMDLVRVHAGRELTLATIPAEDPKVYDMICDADTVGVFQVESRAQMSMLPRLKPRCFYDLVIEVAIIRPGPIQGGMIHPFLRRRDGLEVVRYAHPSLEPVLAKTLGVPLFQEQGMRLAVIAAGFTPGEADELRRAMTHKRSREKLEEMKQRLVEGMGKKGIAEKDVLDIFRQLLGFAGYGFPESHSASFALLVYASAWLKRYHPAAFACALVNSQPMGFYAPNTLVEDARRHGVEVRAVDARFSAWDCTLEGPREGEGARPGERPVLRLGLRLVKGLREDVARALVAARSERPFDSLADLVRRAGLTRAWLERLAAADALKGLDADRRSALWRSLAVTGASPASRPRRKRRVRGGIMDWPAAAEGVAEPAADPSPPALAPPPPVGVTLDLFEGMQPQEPHSPLPAASAADEVVADFAATGMSARAHPLSLLRPALARAGVKTAIELARTRDRQTVQVAGMVIVRQRPGTANGVVFISLEDETGIANLVVMPDVYARFRAEVRGAPFVLAKGRVERASKVVNIRVRELTALTLAPEEALIRSRDFH